MTEMRRLLASLLVAHGIACASDDAVDAASGTPSTPANHDGGFTHADPESCATCHPNHVREWEMSSHAYAMRDPVFHALVRLGQADTNGEIGDFCVQCHSPVGVAEGEFEVVFDESAGVFTQATEAGSPAAMAGVSCIACHSVTSVETTANADFTMTFDGVRRATIRSPIETTAHDSEYSGLHEDADFCGSCHQVVNDLGFAVERTHREWIASRFNGAETCQDCHMRPYEGPAAIGGPDREVHRHTFTGVDVSLLAEEEFPGYFEMRDLVTELLQESVEFGAEFDPDASTLTLELKNLAGHAVPSGATADREMWIELTVTNEAGQIVMQSGMLDDLGDLGAPDPSDPTTPGADPLLVLYTQRLYRDPANDDPPGSGPREPVEFLWEPNADESNVLPAGGVSRPSFDLSGLESGAYTANIRLLFRSFQSRILRLLEEEVGLDPDVRARVPIVEMNRTTVVFQLN